MKIYGNSKSDGFPLMMAAIGALFAGGAWAMVYLSGITLLGSIAAFGLLVVLMVVRVQRWDVMSEPTADTTKHVVDAAKFPVAGDSDVAAAKAGAAWAPSSTSKASLPKPVENPKPAVETNAIV